MFWLAQTSGTSNKLVGDLKATFPSDEFTQTVSSESFQKVMKQFDSFVSTRCQTNPTFQFWYSYLEMVQTLLLFLRATKEGNWVLHLSSLRCMMPWFFAYDRTNYSRYSPAYWLEMMNLDKTHPYINEHLHQGEFVVQRQTSYGFSQIACDQTIEQTANRESKTKGGLTGITINKGAVHRWILSHPARAKIYQRCEEMAGKSNDTRARKDLDNTRIKKEEKAVESLISTIEVMANPFLCEEDGLVSISSGVVASEEVQKDLMRAQEVGERSLTDFIDTRLCGDKEARGKDIFSPIKQQKLKTFSNAIKYIPSSDKVKNISLKSCSDLLGRIIMVSQVKKIDIKETLNYSLNSYPPALAYFGGAPVKTDKFALRKYIEENIPSQKMTPETGSAWIFDGMAILQQLKNIPPTFEKLADKVLRDILSIGNQYGAKRIDFVSDCYPSISIKGCERDRRSSSGVQQIKIMRRDQKTPSQFRKFLSSGTNKEALVDFFFQQWQKCEPGMLKDVIVYISHGQKCHSLTVDENSTFTVTEEIHELCADHEEADTRMLLHASHASKDYNDIVIRSADTDVFVIAITSAKNIDSNVYMHMGPWSNCRILAVSAIAKELGDRVSDALVGFHCFTGCDSVSAFKGKGKIQGYKLMVGNDEYVELFSSIGKQWGLEGIPLDIMQKFVCELYGKPKIFSVNEARYEIFRLSYKTDTALPPNIDCLINHTKRASYQAGIYRRCLQTSIEAPSPVENGWEIEQNCLRVVWNSLPIAPDSIMKSVSCSCKKSGCIQKSCCCQANSLKCSELCKCSNCDNIPDTVDNDDSPLQHSDTDDEDEINEEE